MRPLLLLDPGPLPASAAVAYSADFAAALPPATGSSGIALILPATAVLAARPHFAQAARTVTPAVRVESSIAAAVALDAGAGLLVAAAPLVVPGAPLLSELHANGGSAEIAAAVRSTFGEPLLLHLPRPLDPAARAAIAGVGRAAGGRGLLYATDAVSAEEAIADGSADGAAIDVRGLPPETAAAVVISFDRAVRRRSA